LKNQSNIRIQCNPW